MGIKGIYAELPPARRISLAKLAAQYLAERGRPLRVAVDIAIWHFQMQAAARGGSHPAVRTLFYRLNRLKSLGIDALFVFDGPRKPEFKRNKRTARSDGASASAASALSKRLIALFGYPSHDAPGEAEAECALLQQRGFVDAVLSEDVDTLMFGSTLTLRNWSSDSSTSTNNSSSSSTPTHVSAYYLEDLQQQPSAPGGLDREGMVLVALMSGGDYLPDGIPGCGVKVACEAARAGFGRRLCRLKRTDEAGLRRWRDELIHELRTNEHGHFRTKHKALSIPDTFPNLHVLRYYTHPVVSDETRVQRLLSTTRWTNAIDLPRLQDFVRDILDWNYRSGAEKFVRLIGPTALVDRLLQRDGGGPGREGLLVTKISSQRNHTSTDGTRELRAHFIPLEVTGIDPALEPEEGELPYSRGGEIALNSDDEDAVEEATTSSRTRKAFDASQSEAVWVLEAIVQRGAASLVDEWRARQQALAAKKQEADLRKQSRGKASTSSRTSRPRIIDSSQVGALDHWVQITKKQVGQTSPKKSPNSSPPPTSTSSNQPSYEHSSPKESSTESASRPSRVRHSSFSSLPSSSTKTPLQPVSANPSAPPSTLDTVAVTSRKRAPKLSGEPISTRPPILRVPELVHDGPPPTLSAHRSPATAMVIPLSSDEESGDETWVKAVSIIKSPIRPTAKTTTKPAIASPKPPTIRPPRHSSATKREKTSPEDHPRLPHTSPRKGHDLLHQILLTIDSSDSEPDVDTTTPPGTAAIDTYTPPPPQPGVPRYDPVVGVVSNASAAEVITKKKPAPGPVKPEAEPTLSTSGGATSTSSTTTVKATTTTTTTIKSMTTGKPTVSAKPKTASSQRCPLDDHLAASFSHLRLDPRPGPDRPKPKASPAVAPQKATTRIRARDICWDSSDDEGDDDDDSRDDGDADDAIRKNSGASRESTAASSPRKKKSPSTVIDLTSPVKAAREPC